MAASYKKLFKLMIDREIKSKDLAAMKFKNNLIFQGNKRNDSA